MPNYLLSLLIIFFVFSGCGDNNLPKSPELIEVGVIKLKSQNVTLERELSGRIKASVVAQIRPEVSGIVKKVTFQEGQIVNKGDILYKISPDVYESLYEGADASLQSAKANLQALELKKQRYEELIKFDGISKQDYDDVIAAYSQSSALVKEKEAALKKAKIDLEKTNITSPISGTIGISSVTEGALVTALQSEPLATVRTINPVYVDLSQSSDQVLALKNAISKNNIKQGGTEVKLKLLDGSFYEHKGFLKLREIAVDESTSTVTLRAEFPNPNGILLPGMYVRAIVEESVSKNAFLVPQQAVLRDSRGNPIITVITEENGTKTKVVSTQKALGDKWLVTEGVDGDDKIVIEGLNRISGKSKVTFADVTDKYIGAK